MSKETLEEFKEKPESDWEWMMFPNKVFIIILFLIKIIVFKEGQSILVLLSKK